MDCCNYNNNKTKKCIRKKDKKIFNLPRRFTKKRCLNGPIRGFTMRSSCAPFKFCRHTKKMNGGKNKSKSKFLFNPDDPKKSFDVYVDKNPNDTIPIKYSTVSDVKNTIQKLEKLYKNKKYTHKRIWQVGMIIKVRLGVIKKYKKTKYKNAKNVNERYNLSKKYFEFLGKRSKVNGFNKRSKMVFKI
tara:strand:- start:2120 stop:2680 length:561 start_codon:yes stop_codon:yes gene_type:complete